MVSRDHTILLSRIGVSNAPQRASLTVILEAKPASSNVTEYVAGVPTYDCLVGSN